MYRKLLASSKGSINSNYGYLFFQYMHNFTPLYFSKLKIKLYKNDYIPTIDSLR